MNLKITTVNNRTDITDSRGNTIATLYGVGSIEHDGKVLVGRLSDNIKTKVSNMVLAASGTVTKPTTRSKKRGNK